MSRAAIMDDVIGRQLHSWNVSPKEAREIQQDLAPRVDMRALVGDVVRYVAGLDVSPPDERGVVKGAVVVLSYPDLEIAEVGIAEQTPTFPYVPGLLSFREAPVLLEALDSLSITPDLLILDGQGYAHPRRFGLACHLGLVVDLPTIGCAKSLLVGDYNALDEERGATADLVHKGEIIGLALRSRTGVQPLYVSVGHKVDLSSAARWVFSCCTGYRQPQTTRMAHAAAGGKALPKTRPAMVAT